MSKRKRREERLRTSEPNLTASPPPPVTVVGATNTLPPPDVLRRPGWWPTFLGGVLLFFVGGALAWVVCLQLDPSLAPWAGRSPKVYDSLKKLDLRPRPRALVPVTDEDRLVDLFVRQRAEGNPAAGKLLAPCGIDPTQPVTPEQAERIESEQFLRSDAPIAVIWPGENGKPGDAPNHYTLVMKGGVTGPPLRTREDGKVSSSGRRVMISPDVIVEVRDGKVHALRAQMHEGPEP